MSDTPIRTRIAPSPTGIAHVGTLYIALFNYAFAKQHGGQFIVRIEDTDRNRFVEGAEEVIFEALEWAGIVPDESVVHGGEYGPYRQSERLETYQQYVEQLIEQGDAYYCFCTSERLADMRAAQQAAKQPPKYDRHCLHTYSLEEARQKVAAGEQYVVRLRVPEGKSQWTDMIRGDVEIDHAQIDDQVLLKSDGFPTYHMAVVVDDHLMGITHVMRGEEWISSTPKHLILYEKLGFPVPQYAHMPLLRNTDKSKLSKRKNDVSIVSYRDKGYLPQALLNFLMLLGWSHPDNKEFPISLEEFVRVFDMDRMQKTGPVFDVEKLNWMNGKYLREVLSQTEVAERVQQYLPENYPVENIPLYLPLVLDRMGTLLDFADLTDFFYQDTAIDTDQLLKKGATPELVVQQLQETATALEALPEWKHETIETAVRALQELHTWKKGQYFMMLRLAATGRKATPPLFETIHAIGKERVLGRFADCIETLR
ncbi:glutamate--tRNA ligase [Candidatus Woesebacteria bacterium]|nr:glutamate--tRNA ligase [Candidatus Woesebacteria bacterium]MCD8506823.1 glutamate--tRNA ligase [Candidatus Woesebacteria bacterium]MCD8527559.1 glutamate--tRNA ligase [Candidatus Woesebacteria bacterium]MCD8546299.1 glutamate--tRNA ligase [Candidatus Woesebacteria bacterium]